VQHRPDGKSRLQEVWRVVLGAVGALMAVAGAFEYANGSVAIVGGFLVLVAALMPDLRGELRLGFLRLRLGSAGSGKKGKQRRKR
jgi:hypothetical protein